MDTRYPPAGMTDGALRSTPSIARLLGLSGYGRRRPNPTYATPHALPLTSFVKGGTGIHGPHQK